MTLLQVFGPVAIPTLVCLGIGLVLLLIELFTPGFGVAGAAGTLCLVAVVVMQYAFGDPRVATYLLAIILLILLLAILWFVRSFQRGRLSKSFLVLNDRIDGASIPDVAAAKKSLIGKTGVALTALRPSGIADIEGARVDVMTAGAFIEKGRRVEVVNAEGMHILVREPLEKAADSPEAGQSPEQA